MPANSHGLITLAANSTTAECTGIPHPSRHWKARILLPALILGGTGALLAYSARSSLLPLTDVWVTPVVALPHGNQSPDSEETNTPVSMIVQAPGWIEPAPYPIGVPALTEGVVSEVLALEGDRVTAGQVVVRLVNDDAKLAVQRAEAQLDILRANLTRAQAELDMAHTRVEELRDQLDRATVLVNTAGGPEGSRKQLAIRHKEAEQNIQAMEGVVAAAKADIRKQEVACAGSQLALSRMEIRSPVSGVVMTRLVEPGTRISMGPRASGSTTEPMSGAVLRLYDPMMLQVRVDVPLADFGKLTLGCQAEIETEALPDLVLKGTLTRVVHEANIQRNTVPVKVAIEKPSDLLKPEMLARVRFYGSNQERVTGAGTDTVRLVVADAVLMNTKEKSARVWVVLEDSRSMGNVVSLREIETGPTKIPGFVEIKSGLRLGDRIVVNPPASLRKGDRIRVLGEINTATHRGDRP